MPQVESCNNSDDDQFKTDSHAGVFFIVGLLFCAEVNILFPTLQWAKMIQPECLPRRSVLCHLYLGLQ